jgi:predicted membrane protein
MMTFITVVAGVMVGTLLASGVAFAIVMHPKTLKWYMAKVQNSVNQVIKDIEF